jgi:hypothetical protein
MFALYVAWTVLACVIVALASWRKIAARQEDDYLHIGRPDAIASQFAVARKLDRIDRWGKILTAALVVYGLVLLLRLLYVGWVSSQAVTG